MVTAITGLPAASFLNQSMRALLLVIVAFILLAVVMKPKEIFSFLGLNGNILKGFGIALICVLPLYLVFPFFGNFNTELTFQVFYNKCILTGFKEELVFRAFMFGLLFRYAKQVSSGQSYCLHFISLPCIFIRDTMSFRHWPLSV